MSEPEYRLGWEECLELLRERLAEKPAKPPPPIQLLTGPRQVGKTTVLTALSEELGERCLYAACDSQEAAFPGYFEQLWTRAEKIAADQGLAVVLVDEVQSLPDWARRLKAEWDRLRRKKLHVSIVATGSSALRLATGSRESLAGRFERITLSHWTAGALAQTFDVEHEKAAEFVVRLGAYPGAYPFRKDLRRWIAYVRESILEPAIGRDILALGAIRKPALLRQVFSVAASSPARIVSLQKIQGSLHDAGSLETIAYYLSLLEEAYLVAGLEKHTTRPIRQRSAPPKLIVLSNALLAATDPLGPPALAKDPSRFGAWLENACIAHAVNAGQRVTYWREEPLEVDAVIDGAWGKWAVEVKSGPVHASDLRGLLEFHARFPSYAPILLGSKDARSAAERAGVTWMDWREYLVRGLSESAK
ncbi:MAG: ATP-binding protein [Planctomycetes bacterium]|nr:ATP-binding protein [Planctomycetota bacterium]